MTRETGKQRSQRIEIDYYRKQTGLDRLRKACVLGALILTGSYVGYVMIAGNPSTHLSTGKLAKAHASFEKDCNQCHQGFSPIDSQSTELNFNFIGIQASDSVARIENACSVCHSVGDHYRATMTVEASFKDQNCAGCHRDHLGRDHDLLNVASARCVACHANLKSVCQASPTVAGMIDDFSMRSHGDFKSLLQPDSGVIKFDHTQHMLAGQVDATDRGAFKLSMLAAEDRDRYRRPDQTDDDLVSLDCSSCHQPAGNPQTSLSLATDGELGRYMMPIAFEHHCSACHAMQPGIATEQTTPIPHAVPWQKTELLLASTLGGMVATGMVRDPDDDSQSTPQTGESFGTHATKKNSDVSQRDPRVLKMRATVETQCLKCHEAASITSEAIIGSKHPLANPMIPPRWLSKGLFDHAAHREMDCRFCHAGAYPISDANQSHPPTDQDTVMIAGIESCVGCHRDENVPASEVVLPPPGILGGMRTWATSDCTLCHRYHSASSSQ